MQSGGRTSATIAELLIFAQGCRSGRRTQAPRIFSRAFVTGARRLALVARTTHEVPP
jgi:hypothetical protein